MADDLEHRGDEVHRTQIQIARIGAAAVIAAAVAAAMITGGFGLLSNDEGPAPKVPRPDTRVDGGNSVNSDTCVAGGVVVEGDVNCTEAPTDPRPRTTTADAGCGSVEGVPARASLTLTVVMWCAPRAVRDQYQYKLKVSVKNTGKSRLDIRPERFVLLWRTLDPSQWSPPVAGAPAPPREVEYLERDYWAISANPDGVAEPRPDVGDYTFATHWDHRSLAPGEVSLQTGENPQRLSYENQNGVLETLRFDYHEDDLVFYVPVETVNRDDNFLGLGYVAGDRVVALCPQGQWGPKVPPSVF